LPAFGIVRNGAPPDAQHRCGRERVDFADQWFQNCLDAISMLIAPGTLGKDHRGAPQAEDFGLEPGIMTALAELTPQVF
jgi:hypothetical protein